MEAKVLQELFRSSMPLFIALGDEVRLSIIGVLSQTGLYDDQGRNVVSFLEGYHSSGKMGMNVKEITEQTSLSRPAISHHLKILKDAGLVNIRQEGTANYYYLTIEKSTRDLRALGRYLEKLLPGETTYDADQKSSHISSRPPSELRQEE